MYNYWYLVIFLHMKENEIQEKKEQGVTKKEEENGWKTDGRKEIELKKVQSNTGEKRRKSIITEGSGRKEI